MRDAKNILRHELIGLECTVVKAENKAQAGIQGTVEDETLKTVVVNGKKIFKKGSVFRIKLDHQTVEIDGDQLMTRPEDRIKKKIKRW